MAQQITELINEEFSIRLKSLRNCLGIYLGRSKFSQQDLSDLIGIGVTTASEAAPWIFEATFPAGALVFWAKRRKLITEFQANKSLEADA